VSHDRFSGGGGGLSRGSKKIENHCPMETPLQMSNIIPARTADTFFRVYRVYGMSWHVNEEFGLNRFGREIRRDRLPLPRETVLCRRVQITTARHLKPQRCYLCTVWARAARPIYERDTNYLGQIARKWYTNVLPRRLRPIYRVYLYSLHIRFRWR